MVYSTVSKMILYKYFQWYSIGVLTILTSSLALPHVHLCSETSLGAVCSGSRRFIHPLEMPIKGDGCGGGASFGLPWICWRSLSVPFWCTGGATRSDQKLAVVRSMYTLWGACEPPGLATVTFSLSPYPKICGVRSGSCREQLYSHHGTSFLQPTTVVSYPE